jgi:PAS domain S-box-containing protein
MVPAIRHAVLCSAVGAVLSALVCLVYAVVGAPAGESFVSHLASVWPLLAVGTLTAGVAGAVTPLVQRRAAKESDTAPAQVTSFLRTPTPTPAEPTAPAATKRPDGRRVLAARVGGNYRLLGVTRRLRRLLGRSAEELRGKPIFNFVHPEDLGIVDQALQTAQLKGKPQVVPCRFLARERVPAGARAPTALHSDTQLLPPLDPLTFVHFRLKLTPRLDARGKIAEYRCRFINVSPRIQANEAVRRANRELTVARQRLRGVNQDLARLKESYRELYHNAPVMYFSLDVRGQLVTFNDTLIRTLGYRREELIHHNYTDLLADPAGRSGAELWKQAPFTEGEVETRWLRKDGTPIDVWIRTVAVLDESGASARYRSSALDLTEKTRLANELRARGDELEQTNARLRHINSELEDFTHVVSHDLKEPLRTLQTYSHILAEEHSTQLGPDGFQYINHLIQASRRLGTLIDDLLNLGQAGRITRAPQVFNLIEAVATVRQDLVDLIQRKEATLLTEGSLPSVVGDQYRITQLLANLVANGLKYNRSPHPQVVIGATASESPHYVTVYVRDNGIGIDPAFHNQIFGIFRRLHQPDEYEGTGAGLAICKKIVEAHGGRIRVESKPGEGATFLFTLPRPSALKRPATQVAAPTPAPPNPTDAPPTDRPVKTTLAAEPATGGPEIVLVEDMVEVGTLLQKLGKKSGQTFTWFTTAEEAWVHLQSHRPDFLLFDINLPGMSGVDLCRRVRALPAFENTPIALFSSEQDPERLDKLRAAGANFFLSKDLLVNPAAWQKKLQELLDTGKPS